MKIAILVCGLARSYKKAAHTLKPALEGYDYDVFLHCWKITEKSVNSKTNSKMLDITESMNPSLDDLKTHFNPLNALVEEQDKHTINGLLLGSNDPYPNNVVCFHESIKRCLSLIENKEQYDAFIVTRFDNYYKDKLKIPTIEPGVIWTPRMNNLYENKKILQRSRANHPGSLYEFMNGSLILGNYEVVKIFANFADDYVNMCKNPKYYLSGVMNYNPPDRILGLYLKYENNLEIKEFIFKYGILRENHINEFCW